MPPEWLLLVVAAAVLVVAAAMPLSRGMTRRRALTTALARVRGEYRQLGAHVETVAPGGDERAAALLRGAAEQWRTTGALLAVARSLEEVEVAERTVAEGMALVHQACERLGITPPELS